MLSKKIKIGLYTLILIQLLSCSNQELILKTESNNSTIDEDYGKVYQKNNIELSKCEELSSYITELGYEQDYIETIYKDINEQYPELSGSSTYQVVSIMKKSYPDMKNKLLYKMVNCFIERSSSTVNKCSEVKIENLASSSITKISAIVNWDDVQTTHNIEISHYNIRYRTIEKTAWEYIRSIDADSTSIEITNLEEGTTYQWQIRTKCNDSSVGSSYNNATAYFTTIQEEIDNIPSHTQNCKSETPTNNTASDITDNEVVLSWDNVEATYYELRLRERGTETWTKNYSITSDSTLIDNLQAETYYEWQIRSVITDCEILIASDYNDNTYYFKTSEKSQKLIKTQDNKTVVALETKDDESQSDNKISYIAEVSNVNINDFNLNSALYPSSNFDLSNWKLQTEGGNTEIKNLSNYEDKLFFTDNSGGMTLINCLDGTTTKNSSYTRTELRYIISPGESGDDPGNNFFLSTSSSNTKSKAGAIGGTMQASLSVDSVTKKADICYKTGRIIIAQIHSSDNQMLRLYYQKFPDHELGVVYLAHNPNCGDEQRINLIGNFIKDNHYDNICEKSQPLNGIGLGDIFTYKIQVSKTNLIVDILWGEGHLIGQGLSVRRIIDMSDSCYENDYLYFKTGVYSQNTNQGDDCDQVTFYNLQVDY